MWWYRHMVLHQSDCPPCRRGSWFGGSSFESFCINSYCIFWIYISPNPTLLAMEKCLPSSPSCANQSMPVSAGMYNIRLPGCGVPQCDCSNDPLLPSPHLRGVCSSTWMQVSAGAWQDSSQGPQRAGWCHCKFLQLFFIYPKALQNLAGKRDILKHLFNRDSHSVLKFC